jgi:hypothetical protein
VNELRDRFPTVTRKRADFKQENLISKTTEQVKAEICTGGLRRVVLGKFDIC